MHPFFTAALILGWINGHELSGAPSSAMLEGLGLAVLAIGVSATIASTAIGMRRRRMPGLWRVLVLMPAYWMLLSCAAWRALIHLLIDPQRWEKTEHGLARTSSRARIKRGRLGLRRPINSGADPRRPPPGRA